MTHLPIWYLSNVDTALCDEVIAECSTRSYNDASMGETSSQKDEQFRNTSIQFLPANHWMETHLKNNDIIYCAKPFFINSFLQIINYSI